MKEQLQKKNPAILGAFPDTLALNVVPIDAQGSPTQRSFSDVLKSQLSEYKERAQEEDGLVPTVFTFQDLSLAMRPTGATGFLWVMENTKMTISISRNMKRALWARVRLSQEYLWSVRDLEKILTSVHAFLTDFFQDQQIKLVPSELDLTVDLTNLDWVTVQNIKESFLSRGHLDGEHAPSFGETGSLVDGPDDIYRRWRRLTGFNFGARASAVSATIYDKYHRTKYKEKEKSWFFDLWREVKDENGDPVWDGESPVWRVEMRLKRPALNELMCEGEFHGIDDAFELERLLPGIWAYLVGHVQGGNDGLPDGWLRYVTPTNDKNRSRWPVHPDWKLVQSAFAQPVCYRTDLVSPEGVQARSTDFDLRPFIRRRKRKVNTDRMIAQIAGCLVTLGAWRAKETSDVSSDLSDTVHYAYQLIEEYLEEKERDFSLLVEKKRLLYSIETAV